MMATTMVVDYNYNDVDGNGTTGNKVDDDGNGVTGNNNNNNNDDGNDNDNGNGDGVMGSDAMGYDGDDDGDE